MSDPGRENVELALEGLYKQYASAIYRRCLGLLRNAEEAEDATQDTFVRFVQTGSKGGALESPFALLYRIATNLCLDRLRHKKRWRTVEPAEFEQTNESPTSNGQTESSSTERRVNNAVDLAVLTQGLSEHTVLIAAMYHVDGYTQDEIARSLNVSRGTINQELKRAAQHIQKRGKRFGYSQIRVIGEKTS